MKVLSEIDKGGYGKVHRVRLDDGSIVARKIFHPSSTVPKKKVPEFLERFRREVHVQHELAAQFPDSFLPVLDYDLDCKKPWFTMPLAVQTLSAKIASDRQSKNVDIAPLNDILDALQILRNANKVHRDLKPANVLLHAGRWKISDFGLVLPVDENERGARLTSSTANLGTLAYQSQEQAISSHYVSFAADIYAFGCILDDYIGTGERFLFVRQSGDGMIGLLMEKCTEPNPAQRLTDITLIKELLSQAIDADGYGDNATGIDYVDDILTSINWGADGFRLFISKWEKVEDLADIDEEPFYELSYESLVRLKELDDELWNRLAMLYCAWAQGFHDFNRCDRLRHLLETIFRHGKGTVRARAAIACAALAVNCNRYSAYRAVISLCNHRLDDQTAKAIAFEIRAGGHKDRFISCVASENKDIDAYHPAIARVLEVSSLPDGFH